MSLAAEQQTPMTGISEGLKEEIKTFPSTAEQEQQQAVSKLPVEVSLPQVEITPTPESSGMPPPPPVPTEAVIAPAAAARPSEQPMVEAMPPAPQEPQLMLQEQKKAVQFEPQVREEVRFEAVPKAVKQALTEAPRAAEYLFGDTPYIVSRRNEHKSLFGFGFILIRGGGAINFQGCLVVPKRMTITMLCQGTSIDFSRATFVHPVTTISVLGGCADVRILIPRGVRLECTGLTMCANFGGPDDMDNNFPVRNSPIIRLNNYGACARTVVELNYIVDPLNIVTPSE